MKLCTIVAVAFVVLSTLGVRATGHPQVGVRAACRIVDGLTPPRIETYARGLQQVLAMMGLPVRTGSVYPLLQRGADLMADACQGITEQATDGDTF